MRTVEEQEQETIEKLPDEIWANILSHLDNNYDWKSLSLTSHKFLSLTNSCRLWLSLCRTQSVHVHLFRRILERFPNLRNLTIKDLTDCLANIDSVIAVIVKSNLNLDHLVLSFNGRLQTVCFEDLGSRFKLKVLKLYCTVTNAHLFRIADTFPLLEEIRTQDTYPGGKVVMGEVVNDEGIHYLSTKLKRLRTIHIYHEHISDKSLVSFASNCAFLEDFTVWILGELHVPIRVTDEGISFLVKNCPHLNSLHIFSFSLKMESFVPKSCPNLLKNLHTLKFEMLYISDEFLYSITQARISLTHFHLDTCRGYSFDGIWKLLNSYRSLKTLVLGSGEFLTNEHIDKLSPFLHNLTTIELCNCPLLSDSAFLMLTQRCPLLCDIGMYTTCLGKEEYEYDDPTLKKNFAVKHLRLPRNNYLSTSTLRRVLSICPKVEKLSLWKCFESNVHQLDLADVLECSRDLLDLNVGHCHLKFTRKDMEFSMIENFNATTSDINDEMLIELAKICPRLLHLTLMSCESVTREGVKEVVKSCERLRTLSLGECKNVDTGLID